MVSFFGLKFGGDKKKPQQETESQIQKLARNDPAVIAGGSELFEPNFSRPGRMSIRPGTANSAMSPTDWKAPYMGGAVGGASSSMVELALPASKPQSSDRRRPSISSLRSRRQSVAKIRSGQIQISSPLSPAAPLEPELTSAALGRPGTASSKLRELTGSVDGSFSAPKPFANDGRPSTSSGLIDAGPKSSLGRFEFGVSDRASVGGSTLGKPYPTRKGSAGSIPQPTRKGSEGAISHPMKMTLPPLITDPHGYPSPPLSIDNADDSLSPAGAELKGPAVVIRKRDTAGSNTLPSPAASVRKEGDELVEGAPVIRNVRAKRDTMTYHTPRRRSLTMELDEYDRLRRAEANKTPQQEGCIGNFSAFNFGVSPTKPRVDSQSSALSKSSIDTSRHGTSDEGSRQGSSLGRTNTTATESISDKASLERVESAASSTRQTTQNTDGSEGFSMMSRQRGSMDRSRSPSITAKPTSLNEEKRDARQRGMSEPMTHETIDRHQESAHIPRSSTWQTGVSEITESARPKTALRPTPVQRSTTAPNLSPSAPPAKATRADSIGRPLPLRSTSSATTTSTTSTQKPGRPRPPPLSARPGTKSTYGPAPDAGNYMRNDPAPSPRLVLAAAQQQPPVSPFSQSSLEGDFPVSMGLPRGRRPTRPGDEPRSTGELGVPGGLWDSSTIDRSALPAPLSPMRSHSPAWSLASGSAAATAPPRLPSPNFSSLEKAISSSSEDLAKSFEMYQLVDGGGSTPSPNLVSPAVSEFSMVTPGDGKDSPRRKDARKAPPRPAPITLPPSLNGGSKIAQSEFGMRSPPAERAGFI